MHLRQKVKTILKDKRFTRNCDIALSIELWKKYYHSYVKNGNIKLENLHHVPTIKDIARHRAVIQNKIGLYPPTSLEIAKNRNIKRFYWQHAA